MSCAFSLQVPGFVQLFPRNSCLVGAGGGGGTVHEAGEKLAKNGESNAALQERGLFVVVSVAPHPRLQISSQREMGTVWDAVGISQHV